MAPVVCCCALLGSKCCASLRAGHGPRALPLPPEFINRVDDFITFEPLQEEQIKQIVVLRAQVELKSGEACLGCRVHSTPVGALHCP